MGIAILKEVIWQGNQSGFISWSILNTVIQSGDKKQIEEIYELLLAHKFIGKANWLLNYYQILPDSFVQKKHTKDLLNVFKEVDYNIGYIDIFSHIDKFVKIEKDFHLKLLNEINNQNKKGKIRLQFELDFFIKHIDTFKKGLHLIKTAYIQQDDLDNHFDHSCKNFIEILKRDPEFFAEYLQHICCGKISLSSRDYQNLSIVWQLPNVDNLIKEALTLFATIPLYSFKEHFANALFERLDDDNSKKAIKLLKDLLKKWKTNLPGTKLIFDIIRHSFRNHMADFVEEFLNLNTSLETFKKINWTDTSFFGSGDIIWADIKRKQYEEVLWIINTIKEKAYRFSKHKAYLNEMIEYEKKHADWERKSKFIDDRW